MEGLCGRACDTCTWRDPLDCPGCQTGPGRPYSGDCGIADCCRKKGHADCSSCTYISCCHLRCQREDMPRRRLRELEEKAGLIERRRQGQGRPSLIYVKTFMDALT